MDLKGQSFSWCVGGAQGSGVDSAANLFARACAFGGFHVFGNREYYSNIIGEHSYFEVRISDEPVLGHTSSVDLLTTFDAETPFLHLDQISEGGALLYDASLVDVPLEKLPTIEPRAKQDLAKMFDEHGLPHTLDAIIQLARQRNISLHAIPYEDVLKADDALGQLPFSTLKRMVNTMSVAASFALIGYDFSYFHKALEAIFQSKPKVVEMNAKAAQLAFDYTKKEMGEPTLPQLKPLEVNEPRVYINGNQAVGLGKLAGGCSVQTYYPISPATDESTFLEQHQSFDVEQGDDGSILVLQTGDEIAAICSAIGAALTGARAATSTSSPGFSLMAEGLGWAGINETPVVVTLYQRGGPSTGLPTRSEQADTQFALNIGHGEFPRIVLASGDLEEAFYDAIRIFNYAEKYQTPAIHLLDKALANFGKTFSYFDLSKVEIERGALLKDSQLTAGADFNRFSFQENGISPRSVLGQPGGRTWYSGDEHLEDGHMSEDPINRDRMMEKRAQKLVVALEEIPTEDQYTLHGPSDAETTLVSYGSPKGALLEAIQRLNSSGHAVNYLQARLLSPFPAQAFTEILSKSKLKIGIEANFSGQFSQWVQQHTCVKMEHLVVKYNGRPITVDEVEAAVLNILSGNAPQKVVLRHGI